MSRSAVVLMLICVPQAVAQTLRASVGPSVPAPDLTHAVQTAPADYDHTLVWEFGPAADWEPAEGSVSAGGTFALELTPIENRLELECGVTVLAATGGIELPVDVLFKRPWRLSPRVEFMVGGGPELVHAFGPNRATFWGGEAVLDFMVWPRRHIGWHVEPGYEITFRAGAPHHGLALAAGLLVGR